MEIPFEQILSDLAEVKKLLAIQHRNEPAPEIISRAELQKRLDISEPTAINLTKKKKIPVIRLGSSIRYNWPAVVKALEKRGG